LTVSGKRRNLPLMGGFKAGFTGCFGVAAAVLLVAMLLIVLPLTCSLIETNTP